MAKGGRPQLTFHDQRKEVFDDHNYSWEGGGGREQLGFSGKKKRVKFLIGRLGLSGGGRRGETVSLFEGGDWTISEGGEKNHSNSGNDE